MMSVLFDIVNAASKGVRSTCATGFAALHRRPNADRE
jgi:hypothetical protein